MSKIFIGIITLGLGLLLAVMLSVMFYDPAKEALKSVKITMGSNNTPPTEDPNAKTAYGVKMQDKCLAEFNDFIEDYGQDYSKCFAEFKFDDEYCGGYDPETQGLSSENVIVILDSSGSMAENIGSETKIAVAKKAVADFLTKMPQSVNTGLIVYGHKGSNSLADKESSCLGIEEVVKLGNNNSSNIINAINSFNPRGWTPIANSLTFAKDIFNQKGKNDRNYLILVSDGIESCEGDPLIAAKDLKTNLNIKLSVIGFITDGDIESFLKKIANIGKGSYLSAESSSGIAKAFNDQLTVIKKDCINVTIFELGLKYKSNNSNNLECWLNAYQKESNDFTENVAQKSPDGECSIEISQALIARQKESWYKKQELEEKNNTIYKSIEADLNTQLKALDN